MRSVPVEPAWRLAERAPELRWLITQLWSHDAVGIGGGEPKCCKSFLALDLAVAVAAGVPCLRRFAVPDPADARRVPDAGTPRLPQIITGVHGGLRDPRLFVAQSLHQIDRAYGYNHAILDNCHVRVAFAPNDERTAKRLSDALGLPPSSSARLISRETAVGLAVAHLDL